VEVVGRVPIDEEHLQRVRKGLRGVVMEGGGTGRRAQVEGVEIGGKTGTAQVVKLEHTAGLKGKQIPWKYRDHAWFGAIAPVDAPEIAVVVLSEHGGGGGANAAPIAQRVLQKWWDKKNAGPVPELQAATVIDTAADEAAHEAAHEDAAEPARASGATAAADAADETDGAD
jgi:penicillin-binding protein 2